MGVAAAVDARESVSGWLTGPSGPVFATLHLPASGAARAAVVLCPPIGFEHYASFRTLRRTAERLAEAGFAALRIDYTGTGDSGADPEDVPDVSVWKADIASAFELLSHSGPTMVGWIGMRIGATLAATTDLAADFRVLWDPSTQGRRYLREATLMAHQVIEGSSPVGPPEEELSGTVGFSFPESFLASLASLSLEGAAPSPAPTLVLTRDGTKQGLPDGLGGPGLEVRTASGQELLMVPNLDECSEPDGTIEEIVTWCAQLASAHEPRPVHLGLPQTITLPVRGSSEVVESTVTIGSGLFGVVTSPPDEARLTLVWLNSGAQHRIGPHRFHVEMARRLAGQGVRSVRVDLRSIGDSPDASGPRFSVYWPAALDDLDAVARYALTFGTPVAVAGLCSGGYHSLEMAAKYPLVGAVAIHFDFDSDAVNAMPGFPDPRREVWIEDRPWLQRLGRHRQLLKLKYHVPAWAWVALERLRIQDELSAGVRRLATRCPAELVLVVERHVLQERRLSLLRRVAGRATVIESPVDHGLVAASARAWMAEVVTGPILRWGGQPTGGAG